jgi:hypothetical protein
MKYMDAKCECGNCGVNIEFETESFIEKGKTATKIFGQNVTCPNCHKVTILTLPNKEKPSEGDITNQNRIEDSLETIAKIFFWIGMIGAGAAVFIIAILGNNPSTLNIDSEQVAPAVICLIIFAIVSIAQGCVIEIVLKAFAEIIRLLRKAVCKS